jgi:hypothetical protein
LAVRLRRSDHVDWNDTIRDIITSRAGGAPYLPASQRGGLREDGRAGAGFAIHGVGQGLPEGRFGPQMKSTRGLDGV